MFLYSLAVVGRRPTTFLPFKFKIVDDNTNNDQKKEIVGQATNNGERTQVISLLTAKTEGYKGLLSSLWKESLRHSALTVKKSK
ncbi:MAG: hypothetical protein V4450_16795 [Bacteroidota bacterium]